MMRKLLYSFLFFIFLQTAVLGQVWSNPITGTTPSSSSPYVTSSGQTINPNVRVSGVVRGSGLNNTPGNDSYNTSDWNTVISNTSNDYLEFTIKPNDGYSINFSNFVYTSSVSNNSNWTLELRSSVNNFGSNISNVATGGTGGGNTTISLSAATFQNVTSAITFRIYGNNTNASRIFNLQDFVFNGTVNCISPVATGTTICTGSTGTISATSASATTTNVFSGFWNASTDQVANMPTGGMVNTSPCSFDAGVSRNYTSVSFTVNTTGSYVLKMTDTGSYDGMAYIYSGAFTPGSCSGGNWIVGSDDDGTAQTEPRLTANLTAGVVYTLISTTWAASSGTYSGSYTWTVTPPSGGQVSLSPILWYNSVGNLIGGGSPFNPVGVAGGLADTNTPGTTTFFASSGGSACTKSQANFVINGTNTPTTSVGTYSFCVDSNNTQTTGNINASQYALVNVIQGYKYTFQVGDIFSGNNEKINILNAATDLDVSPAATNTGAAGTSVVEWPAPFSGQVKVVVSTGSCSNNGTVGTGGLSLSLISVGNTLDDQSLAGTTDDKWRGHIYNWTSTTLPPGGTSLPSVSSTTPFSGAEYAGYYDETGESITQGFGGNDVCLPVYSNGVVRGSIRTEQFAVRYRMKSTKTGCYMVTVRGDDGVRLYIDGVKVVDQWQEQSPTTYSNVFVNLTGSSVLVLDYYENGGGNILEFSMAAFNASSNTITAPATTTVCSGTSPGLIDGSSYQYNGTAVNPTVKFQWESSANATGPWASVTTGTGRTSEDYTPAAITGNTTQNVTYYRRTVSSATSGTSCSYSTTPISITTNPAATLTRTSAASTQTQTVCSGSAIANIVYTFGGGATGVAVTNLPAGLTSNINAGTLTISGTPTAGGTFTVTTTGQSAPCTEVTATGTITVNTAATLVLTSGTASPTVCPGTAITNIVYTFGGGATGVSVTGLPAGLSSNVNAGTVTISGTPTAGGNYSISTTGQTSPCTAVTLGGTVTISPVHTITAGSNRSVCQNSAMTNITMNLGGGATGATVTGLPAGITYAVASGVLTISGTPTVSGVFPYSVTTTGNSCATASTSGTITIGIGNNTITYAQGTSGYVCINADESNSTPANFIAPTGTYFNTVSFASYGTALGSCPSFTINSSCHAPQSQGTVESKLLGNSGTIQILPSNNVFPDPCVGTFKYLRVVAYYSQAICYGTAPGTISGSDPTGNGTYTYEWQSSTSAAGPFTAIPSTNTKDYTPGILAQSAYFRRVVTSAGCTSTSPILLIKVNPLPTIATAATASTICNGATSTSLTYTGTTGAPTTYSITWNASPANTFAAVTDASLPGTSPISITIPSTTAANTYTGTITVKNANGCISTGNSFTLTVRPQFTAGAIDSAGETICYGGNPSSIGNTTFASGGDGIITYQWQSSTDAAFTAPVTIANNNSAYTPPTGLTVNTWYRRQAKDGTCNTTFTSSSNVWAVTVRQQFTAGAINSTGETICYGGNPSSIGNTTFASGGNGIITYQWQSSTDAAFTAPVTIANNNAAYTPSTGLTVNMWYRRQAKDGTCNTAFTSSSNVWAVTVRSQFTAGTINSTGETICSGGNPSQIGSTTDASGGNGVITYQWKANGVNIASSNSAVYTPPAGLTTTTTYTRYANDGICNTSPTASSGSWTVTVNSIQNKPSVGTITNVTCLSQGSVNLGNVPSSGSFQINQTGDASRSITVASSTGSTYTVSGLVAGTYYFTVQTATTCVSHQSDPVTITDQSSTTWNGSGWSNGVPDSSKSVIIASTAGNPFPTNIEACSLTITVPSGPTDLPVIVKDGITLTITNAVTSNGKLLFESGSNLVQKTDVQNTGEIIYQRKATIARYDLTYWGMPVAKPGFTMKMFSPNTLIDKYFILDPATAGWEENYNGTLPMIAGKGYSIRAPQSFPSPTKQEFIGTFEGIPNNGDIPVTVVSGKWNLIGNPYPSSINAEKFRDDNPGIGALYFWAHVNLPVKSSTDHLYYYTDDFVVYNGLGSVDTGEANYFKGQIGAAQGFIVKAPTATVNFNNSQRNGGNNSQFYKTAQSTIEKNRVWLNLKNTEGIFKQILLGYTTGATNALDVDFDALSMASNPVVDFYSIGTAKKLTIQGRALPFVKSDVVPLGYLIANKGDYTISIDHADGLFSEGQDVFLEDKTNGKITNLRLENYKFTTAAGTFNNRFAIRYTSATLGVDDVEGLENSVLVSVKNREVKITSSNEAIKEVNIFDIGAQLIYTKNNVNSSELQISNLQSSDQALLVKITLENGYTFTKKIIFSNL